MANCGVWVHPQLKLIVVVLLQTYGLTSAQLITVEFLTAVPRLSSNTTVDYYFCCNVEGRFLQWQYDNQPLSGFLIDDIGRVFVDERLDYNYTATLLSSEPMDNNQAKMDSVLVLSFHNGTAPSKFNVTCSSNLNINSTTSGPMDEVKDHTVNEKVQLDYVVSGNIVGNRNKTYLFMCGVSNTPQFIEFNGRIFGFSGFDDVGLARTVFLEDRNTADVQGILITRESYQAVTLVLVATSANVVNVSCYDNDRQFALSLQLLGEKKLSENVPKDRTDDILVTTLNSTGSIAKNVTELMDLSNDPFTMSITSSILSINLIIVVVMVVTIIVVVLVLTEIVILIAYKKNIRSTKRTDMSNTVALSEVDLKSFQKDVIHYRSSVLNDWNEDEQESSPPRTEVLFKSSQDETSYSDKASANGPLTSNLHSSIMTPPTEDSEDRMLYMSSKITKDINKLVYKRNGWKKEAKPTYYTEHIKCHPTGQIFVCGNTKHNVDKQQKEENELLLSNEIIEINNGYECGKGIEEDEIGRSIALENNSICKEGENNNEGWKVKGEEENNHDSEISDNWNVSQDEKVRQDKEVSQDEKVGQDIEVSEEVCQDTKVSQNEKVGQDTEVSQVKEISQDTEVSQDMEVSQDIEVSQDKEVSQDIEVSQDKEVSQDTEVSQDKEVSQDTEVSKEVSQDKVVRQDMEVCQDIEVCKEVSRDKEVGQDGVDVETELVDEVNKEYQVCSPATTVLKAEKEMTPLMPATDSEHELRDPGGSWDTLQPTVPIFSCNYGSNEDGGRSLDHSLITEKSLASNKDVSNTEIIVRQRQKIEEETCAPIPDANTAQRMVILLPNITKEYLPSNNDADISEMVVRRRPIFKEGSLPSSRNGCDTAEMVVRKQKINEEFLQLNEDAEMVGRQRLKQVIS